jgi:hypothetical protein
MVGMPPLPGGAPQQAPQQAPPQAAPPQPPQAPPAGPLTITQTPERDPAPPQGALSTAAAAVAPKGLGASDAVLKKLCDNNEEIIVSLNKLGEGLGASNAALQTIAAAVSGNSRLIAVLLAIHVDLVERLAQQPRTELIPGWAAAINGGQVEQLLTALGQLQQGKG